MHSEASMENNRATGDETLPPVRWGPFRKLTNAATVLFASKTAIVGLFIVLFWVSTALFAPYITGYGPNDQD